MEFAQTLDEALETGKKATVGVVYRPVLEVKTQEEANQMLSKIIRYLMANNEDDYTEEELKDIALSNIGYVTGYASAETARRVNNLFKTAHPIFGNTRPTPEEAFKAGINLGQR